MTKKGFKFPSPSGEKRPEILKETLKNLEEAFGEWERLVAKPSVTESTPAMPNASGKEAEVVTRARQLLLSLKEQLDELS